MNELNAANPAFEPTREDVLIGRVIDGEASSADWDALDTIARTEPAVWERLGRAQRVHARLERDVDDAIAIAELIELPAHHVAAASLTTRFQRYGGWAVAAVLGLALIGGYGWNIAPSTGVPFQQAGFSRALSPDEALDQYVQSGLASGRVLGEMPTVLVDTRPVEDGRRQEVLYVRQILERKFVTDVSIMSVEMDENGVARYVPYRADQRSLGTDQATQILPNYQRPF